MSSPQEFETRPIPQLLWTYALPAIVGQLVSSIYNIADRVILGQNVGPLAIAGLAITLPVMNIIHAFGSLVGAGSAARLSIVLGRKDIHWAEKILGNSMLLTFFFGFLFVTGGYLFMDAILSAFGASPDTLAYARTYMYIVLPGMFFTTLAFNLTGYWQVAHCSISFSTCCLLWSFTGVSPAPPGPLPYPWASPRFSQFGISYHSILRLLNNQAIKPSNNLPL